MFGYLTLGNNLRLSAEAKTSKVFLISISLSTHTYAPTHTVRIQTKSSFVLSHTLPTFYSGKRQTFMSLLPFDLQAKFIPLPICCIGLFEATHGINSSNCWQTSGNALPLCWRSLSGPIEILPQHSQCDKRSYIFLTKAVYCTEKTPTILHSHISTPL